MSRPIVVNGVFSIVVDDIDYSRVATQRWTVVLRAGDISQIITRVSTAGIKRRTTLARFIMNPTERARVIRISGTQQYDFSRDCFLICNYSESQAIAPKRKCKTTSRYKGVSRTKELKWRASIRPSGQSFHLGDYDTEKEAALAYDKAALHHFGPNAFLNFPEK